MAGIYNADGLKLCKKCRRWLPPSQFYREKRGQLTSPCKNCRAAWVRTNKRRINADRLRRYHERRRDIPKPTSAFDPITGLKFCRTCGQTKAAALHFYRHQSGTHAKAPDPYRDKCKSCTRDEYATKWRDDKATLRRRVMRYASSDRGVLNQKARASRRRARLTGGPWHFKREELAALLERQKGRCAICARKLRQKWHADHIVPLGRGGDNAIRNIQITCNGCNLQKGAKDPIVFMKERGFLL